MKRLSSLFIQEVVWFEMSEPQKKPIAIELDAISQENIVWHCLTKY